MLNKLRCLYNISKNSKEVEECLYKLFTAIYFYDGDENNIYEYIERLIYKVYKCYKENTLKYLKGKVSSDVYIKLALYPSSKLRKDNTNLKLYLLRNIDNEFIHNKIIKLPYSSYEENSLKRFSHFLLVTEEYILDQFKQLHDIDYHEIVDNAKNNYKLIFIHYAIP